MIDWLLKKTDLGGVEGSNGGTDTQISDVTTGCLEICTQGWDFTGFITFGYDWLYVTGCDWLRLVCPVGGGHVELRAWDFQEALVRWATKHLPC